MPRGQQSVPVGAVPTQVTIIGHNGQVVATAGFFVGADVPVQVFTASAEVELLLGPYPGVQVTRVDAGYASRPQTLPPPPYFVAVDTAEETERITTWLPPTTARFLVRAPTKRHAAAPKGLLTLRPHQSDDRRRVLRRLATLHRADLLMDLARRAQHPPIILMYADPDPDAIGAALGLMTMWRAAGTEPVIRYTGEVRRYQNKLLLAWLKRAPIARLVEGELARADLVAVVDAQPGFWRDNPPQAQVVIDHHPRREDLDAEFVDLRENYGATSTILSEYLAEAELRIDRQLATALLYGIVTDTDDLKRKTHQADIRAFELLHGTADGHFLARLQKSQVPMGMLDDIAWGISHRVVYRDLVLVNYGQVDDLDTLVQAADLLLLTCGITCVVVAGMHADRLVVIFRGDGHRQDVGAKAMAAFGKMGSAGGHRTMGRAEIPLNGMDESATAELIVDNLFRRMSPGRRGHLIRRLRRHLQAPGPAEPEEFEFGT